MVPHQLLPEVVAAKGPVETVSVLEQLTLAEFITSGAFDRHVRARRQTYRHRRDQLLTTLRESRVRVTGIAAGLQAVLRLPPGTEAAVRRTAATHDLLLSSLADFQHEATTPARDALVINYAALSNSAWPQALKTLTKAMP